MDIKESKNNAYLEEFMPHPVYSQVKALLYGPMRISIIVVTSGYCLLNPFPV
jgi:hypothetical protein